MLNLEDPNNILLDLESVDITSNATEENGDKLQLQIQELKLTLINDFVQKLFVCIRSFEKECSTTKREKIDVFIKEIQSQIKGFQTFRQKINLLSLVPSFWDEPSPSLLFVGTGFLLGVSFTLAILHFYDIFK
jgi:hypothetical protein